MPTVKLTLNSDGSENKRELVDEVIVGTPESIQIEINQLTMQRDYSQDAANRIQGLIDNLAIKLNLFKDAPVETVVLPAPPPEPPKPDPVADPAQDVPPTDSGEAVIP